MNIRALVTTALLALLVLTPTVVAAQGLIGVQPPQGTSTSNLVDAVRFIINGLLVLAALAAMVFLIIGGVQYIISRGDEDAAATAKNTILYAIIGLIVIGLAAAVVNFIVGAIQAS